MLCDRLWWDPLYLCRAHWKSLLLNSHDRQLRQPKQLAEPDSPRAPEPVFIYPHNCSRFFCSCAIVKSCFISSRVPFSHWSAGKFVKTRNLWTITTWFTPKSQIKLVCEIFNAYIVAPPDKLFLYLCFIYLNHFYMLYYAAATRARPFYWAHQCCNRTLYYLFMQLEPRLNNHSIFRHKSHKIGSYFHLAEYIYQNLKKNKASLKSRHTSHEWEHWAPRELVSSNQNSLISI